MLEGMTEQLWEHTSSLAAVVMNLFREQRNWIKPEDIDPVKQAKKKPVRISAKSSFDALVALMGAKEMGVTPKRKEVQHGQ